MDFYEKQLIEAAKKRDKEEFDTQESETLSWRRKYIISLIPYLVCVTKNITDVTLFALMLAIFAGFEYRKNKKQLDELKKYREYLSMYKELEKDFNKDITRIIEIDSYKRKPLNIYNIDSFSYRDIKIIKKELERRKHNIK